MRRIELVEAIHEAHHYVSGLRLRRFTRPDKDNEAVLHTIKHAARYGHTLSSEAKQVLAIFDMEALLQPETFESSIRSVEGRMTAGPVRNGVLANDYLPMFAQLLKNDVDRFGLREKDRVTIGSNEFEVIRIVAPEEEGKSSHLSRYLDGLKATSELYRIVSEAIGATDSDLSLVSTDSGSDKSFDLIGLAKTVRIVRKLLKEVWMAIAFHPEFKSQKQIETIIAATDAFAHIKTMGDNGKIDRESEEKLKKGLTRSLHGMYKAGFFTEDMRDAKPSNVKDVLAFEETKQIAFSPSDPDMDHYNEETDSGNGSSSVRDDPDGELEI